MVHWPAGIQAHGEVRTQYGHIIDIVPTVLDVLRADPPETIRGVTQSPIHGVSFAHTFDDASAPSRHHTQYFEMLGHRALDHQGWRAVCPWSGPSFAEGGQGFGVPITGAPGRAQLYVDGQLAGQAEFPVTTPIGLNPGGLTRGANPGPPVVADYTSPFRFTGTLHIVTVDVSGT